MIIYDLYKEACHIGNGRGFNRATAIDNALEHVKGLGSPEKIYAHFYDTISGKCTHVDLTEAQQTKKYFFQILNDAQEIIYTSRDTASYHFETYEKEREITGYFFNIAQTTINLYSSYKRGHYNIVLHSKENGKEYLIDNKFYYKAADGNLIY